MMRIPELLVPASSLEVLKTAVVFGASSQGKLCTACSALHFEPVQHDIEWRITFHEKTFDDYTVALI